MQQGCRLSINVALSPVVVTEPRAPHGQLILPRQGAKSVPTQRLAMFRLRTTRRPSMPDSSTRDSSRDRAISVEAISSERVESTDSAWTRRLVLFLRIMAVVSVVKGLYHWAQVTGFIGGEEEAFENQSLAWQTSTVYFAVIELVAAVGLWLATPWGAVVWLITVVSMTVIELMFPAIYGGSLAVVAAEVLMLSIYLALAWMAARERPP